MVGWVGGHEWGGMDCLSGLVAESGHERGGADCLSGFVADSGHEGGEVDYPWGFVAAHAACPKMSIGSPYRPSCQKLPMKYSPSMTGPCVGFTSGSL